MEETLIRLNPWWNREFIENTIKRDFYLDKLKKSLNKKEIIFLTGLRRIGKTTLIKQTISFLINEKKIHPKKILFVSLDNVNLVDSNLFEIIDEYKKINGISFEENFYLFLDEITYLENFQQQLKNLYDSWDIYIVCSSSNATILNDNKAFLTGRTNTIEVMPLSYKEFLLFKNLKVQKYDKNLNKNYFEEYLKTGGIPRYVLEPEISYLNEIVNSIIYKDIIAQYKIKNEKVVRELFILLAQRVGKPTSYNKLAKILNISDMAVKNYISYFEKTYLFFSCERFSSSKNENITSPKKFYIIDNGIKNLITGLEKGPNFENLLFIELYKNRNVLENINYYLKDGIEIDFITKNSLIEAKYGNSNLSKGQELLFNSLKKKEKLIVRDYTFFI